MNRHLIVVCVFVPVCEPDRQVNDGVWKKQDDAASSFSKHNDDFRKSNNFDLPTGTPLGINDLGGGGGVGGLSSLSNWSPHSSHSHVNPSSHHRDHHPPVPHKGRALEELANRAASDKAVSVEVRLVGNLLLTSIFIPLACK